jgi:hypothetical protein
MAVTVSVTPRMRWLAARAAFRRASRGEVSAACRVCCAPLEADRSTRRYCSNACRQTRWRAKKKPLLAPTAHQRRIRDAEALADPRPLMATLKDARVEPIAYAEAKALVTRYEWLRSMPSGTRACYGLKTVADELAGVVVLAAGPTPESGDLCGRAFRDRAICLARGACVHWAHPHAGSFLISRACKLAHAQFGWKIFYACADPTVGEIGVVYQACNWFYLGSASDAGSLRRRAGASSTSVKAAGFHRGRLRLTGWSPLISGPIRTGSSSAFPIKGVTCGLPTNACGEN